MKFSNVIRVKVQASKRNDCAITSLSYFEQVPYDNAFEEFRDSYSPRTGTRTWSIIDYMSKHYEAILFNDTIAFMVTRKHKESGVKCTRTEKGISLKSFCKKYNKGRYFVLVRKHAIYIENGVVHDIAHTKDGTHIQVAWKA